MIFSILFLSTAGAEKILYHCEGYSSEGPENPDIAVSISSLGKQFSLNLRFGKGNESNITVFRKKLSNGEMSFFDTFFNKEELIRVDVFLDDMGSTSSLYFRGKTFDLTCG